MTPIDTLLLMKLSTSQFKMKLIDILKEKNPMFNHLLKKEDKKNNFMS